MVAFEWPSVRCKWETDFVVAVTANVKLITNFHFPTQAKRGEGGLGNGDFPKTIFLKKMLSTSSCVCCRLWSRVKLYFSLQQQSSSLHPFCIGWKYVMGQRNRKWGMGKGRALLFLPLEMCFFTSEWVSQGAFNRHPDVWGSVSRDTCPERRWLHGAHGIWDPIAKVRCLACLIEAVACNGHCCPIWSCAECHSDASLHLSNTFSYLLQLQRCQSIMLGILDLDLVVFFLCLFQMNNCDSKMLW